MIKKLLLPFMILFSMTAVLYGQTGKIVGKVLSKEGKEISEANVTIKKTNKGTMTNGSGTYSIEKIKEGTYTLIVTFVGYKSQEISVSVVSNQTTHVPTVILSKTQEKLEEVVVQGHKVNKYNIKKPSRSLRIKTEIVNLPQNVQVISGDLLIDQQVTSMMDGVIRNVSGVTMLEHWGHFARINMRGFRLPAFRNGINFSDTWGPLAEDMSTVERIEFVKGPSGFMMSSGQPGGFYNVVTKKPTLNKVGQVSFMAGSFDTYRATVDLGGKITKDGKLLFRLNGMYHTGDTHRGNEKAERFGIAPALTYNFSDNTSITTELNLQNAESFIGSAYVFAPVEDGYGSLDRDFKYTDTNYPATDINEVSIFTNFRHEFSKNWSFEAQWSYLRYDQVGNSTWIWSFDQDTGDAVRYIGIWDALSLGKYFQSYVNGHFSTGSLSHKILGGFDFTEKEYYADFFQSAVIDVNQPFNIYNPVYGNTEVPVFDRSVNIRVREGEEPYSGFSNKAVYFQDEIGFFENKIRLTLAGRYTNLSTVNKDEKDTKFTPRIGLSVDVTPTLKAYALYDQSFLANFGVSAVGETFDPEEANDIEGGIKKTFFNGKLKASLGAFQITKENVLVADPENTNFSIQLGEIQSKGIEFDLQGEITKDINIVLNYANTNVEITKDANPNNIGTKVSGHSKHVTNGWLNYNVPTSSKLKGIGVSLGYQYQVDRSTWTWNADNQSDLPDYFRMDGALSWQNSKFRIQANVNNILNDYLYSGANYGNYLYWQSEPGINGRITLTYKF
ncbi:TonB-dependent receptor [Flavivirga jejuensis]|uniref:TonB-dependent receptor n=1 Tax=Flavivirga jejuensis TaxID=870487 RepID=A0ABT8WKS8_9FLAO|nr:TonB-dependent receptor [Flavivirga jejuensis]MDO5973718.1 TonB-dependent receptor [Flavivirga jejuensis]